MLLECVRSRLNSNFLVRIDKVYADLVGSDLGFGMTNLLVQYAN